MDWTSLAPPLYTGLPVLATQVMVWCEGDGGDVTVVRVVVRMVVMVRVAMMVGVMMEVMVVV